MLRTKNWMPYLEAEGAGGGAPAEPTTPAEPPAESPKEPQKEPEKKYTDAEVDALINKKFAKWQAEQEEKVKEAEKLAKMNAEEKAAYAQKQAEDAQAQLERYQMMGTARGMLSEKSITLADDILDVLVAPEADKTKANIDNFAQLFEAAVSAEVEKRMRGKTPPAGSGPKSLTKEEILEIKDPVARQKTMMENINLFKK